MSPRARDGGVQPRRLDLRLGPVAAAVWIGTVLAPFLPLPALVALAAGSAAGAAALVMRTSAPAALILAAGLAGLATTAGCAAVRGEARAVSPLRALSASEMTRDLVLEVDDEPRPVSGVGARRVVLDATVREIVVGTRTVSTHDAVVLFGPAGDWEGLTPGQLVRARGAVSPAAPGDGAVALVSARGPPATVGGPGRLQRVAHRLRDGLATSSRRVLPGEPGGLLPGLVVGDTRSLDPVLTEDFRSAGLTHLVAVSGANVG